MKKAEPGMGIKISAYLLAAGLVVGLGACSGESTESLLISAKSHIEKNDRKTAIIQLKNALQKNQSLAEARFLLGKVLFDSGDLAGAEVELQKAQELGFDADQVVPLLAKILLATGAADKVITQFGATSLQSPKAQAELHLQVAKALLDVGKRSEAAVVVLKALSVDANNLDAKILQVRMQATDRNLNAANAQLAEILAAHPKSSEVWQLRGELLQFEGKLNEALEAFRQALSFGKDNLFAHRAALIILLEKQDLEQSEAQLSKLKGSYPQHPQTKFFTAVIALERGDLKTALEQSQQLLKQFPEDVRALHLSGVVALKNGDLVLAEASLSQALKADPSQSQIRLQLTEVYLGLGDPNRAQKILQPLMAVVPPLWRANALMAQAYMQLGEFSKAELFFSKAAALNPTDVKSKTQLALAKIGRGKSEQGLNELREISNLDEGVFADYSLINEHLKSKNRDGAVAAIKELAKKQPKSPVPEFFRGQAERLAGRLGPAREAYELALKVDPRYFPAALNIASMDFDEGKSGLAQDRLRKFSTENPKNVRATLALASMRAKVGADKSELAQLVNKALKDSPGDSDAALALVRLHMAHNDFNLALAAAQEGLVANPGNLELMDALGQAQYQVGDYNQALKIYNKMLGFSRYAPLAMTRIAEINIRQGDLSGARASLKKALALQSDFLPAQVMLIGVERAAGQNKEALRTAVKMQELHSNDPSGFVLAGDMESENLNMAMAEKYYLSGLERKSSSEIAVKVHRTLLLSGKRDRAVEFEKQWLLKSPADKVFWFHLGDMELAAHKYDAALDKYKKVIAIDPNNASALNNVAWLLNISKQPGALPYAQKAVKLSPRDASFMDTLAEIYLSNDDLPKAIETQAAALVISPNIHIHRLHLAKLYMLSGDKKKAAAELDYLAKLGDKFAGQSDVAKMKAKL
ncbi:MAG: PEP-CTERM system TPR-repeat protein PrsT [Paucibacter sp.]|nr:PEP-CTERM system TPR-repeat protein PrsT [Roseateles sp.]